MYTATIKKKTIDNGVLRVEVEFSDGVNSIVESCIPQDLDGLKYWVKSRLDTFNGGQEIDSTLDVNDPIDPTEPVVTTPDPTPAEIARHAWLTKYRKWVKVKETLIDTGILTGTEPQLVTLKNNVTNDLLPAYLDYI